MYSRVYVEITNLCNRNCSFCPGTVRPGRQMSRSEFRTIAEKLLEGEMLVDDLIADVSLSAAKVLAMLTILEIKGIVRRLPGKRVCLKQ